MPTAAAPLGRAAGSTPHGPLSPPSSTRGGSLRPSLELLTTALCSPLLTQAEALRAGASPGGCLQDLPVPFPAGQLPKPSPSAAPPAQPHASASSCLLATGAHAVSAHKCLQRVPSGLLSGTEYWELSSSVPPRAGSKAGAPAQVLLLCGYRQQKTLRHARYEPCAQQTPACGPRDPVGAQPLQGRGAR